ncbi:hypothetical protein [Fastidiosibacter lacustris]|uniref:hypothetical protein n=1 Tax=Fastidiosibacter lacustris TaxID=2056695 RepID=UPI000E347C8F|nr:hypothetical protein [Fastidiosibacter lacustris]
MITNEYVFGCKYYPCNNRKVLTYLKNKYKGQSGLYLKKQQQFVVAPKGGKIIMTALLASHYKHLLIVSDQVPDIENDQESIWICLIIAGKVLSIGSSIPSSNKSIDADDIECSGDFFMEPDSISDFLPHIIHYIKSLEISNFKTVIDIRDPQKLAQLGVSNDDLTSNLSMSKLLNDINQWKSSSKNKYTSHLIKQEKSKFVKFVLPITFLAVSYYVYTLYVKYENERLAEIERQKLLVLKKEQEAKEQIRQYNLFIEHLNKDIAYYNLSTLIESLPKFVYLSAGWYLSSVVLKKPNFKTYSLLYNREDYSGLDYGIKLSEALGAINRTQSPDNSQILLDILVQNKVESYNLTKEMFENVTERQIHLNDLITQIQISKLSFSISPTKQKEQNRYYKEALLFNVTGNSKLDLLKLRQILSSKYFVMFDGIKIEFNPNEISVINSFTFQGVIYV